MELNVVVGSFITILVSISCILLAKLKYKIFQNPVTIYCVLWGIATFLVASNFSNNFFPVSLKTIVYFNVAMIFFTFGVLMSPKIKSAYKFSDSPYLLVERRNLEYVFWLLSILCLFLSVYFFLLVIKKYSIDTYFGMGYVIHGELLSGNTEAYPHGVLGYRIFQFILHPLLYVAAALGAMFVAIHRKTRWYYFMPILIALIFDMAIVGRFRIYSVLLFYILAYCLRPIYCIDKKDVYSKKGNRKGKFGIYVMVFMGLGIYGLMAIIRSYYVDNYYDFYGLEIASVFFTPIRYQIGGLYLFDKIDVIHDGFSFGKELLYPFCGKLLNYIGVLSVDYEYILDTRIQIGEYQIMQGFYTYLFVGYRDFGILGVVLYPFLIGWIIGWVYSRAMLKRRLIWIANIIFLYAMVIMPSTIVWGFGELSRVLALYVLIIVTFFSAKRIYIIKHQQHLVSSN